MRQENRIDNVEEFDDFAGELLRHHPSHRIFTFKGDLGAGKTTLIKSFVKNLESSDQVSSPTFSIVNEYISKENTIYHFDLYRIEEFDELEEIGFFEYLDSGGYVFIEWPEIVEDYIDIPHLEINIRILDDKSRNVVILEH